MVDLIFPKWIAEHAIAGIGWKQLNFPSGFKQGQVPLLILLTVAVQTASTKTGKANTVPNFHATVWTEPIGLDSAHTN
jgi:hypothetical protein